MRAGETGRRDTMRLLLAALKQREVDDRKELTDADVVAVIDKMIKQRREAIAQFEKGGRLFVVMGLTSTDDRGRLLAKGRMTGVARYRPEGSA